MSIETEDLNIEWKKSSKGKLERDSRRIDNQKALQYNLSKKNNISSTQKLSLSDIPRNQNKMRKKIRQAQDEEEEDEESFYLTTAPNIANYDAALFNNLQFEEKKSLVQKENRERVEMQNRAGRMSVVDAMSKTAQSSGLKKLRRETSAMLMNDTAATDRLVEKTVQYDIGKRLKIKKGKINPQNVNDFFRGIKRIESIGGKSILKGMAVKDVIFAGKTKTHNNHKIEKTILKKSGRKAPTKLKKNTNPKKAQREFNNILLKKTMLSGMEK